MWLAAGQLSGCGAAGDGRDASGGPGALSVGAVSASETERAGWPQLFGPNRDGTAPGRISRPDWDRQPPPLVWSLRVGSGYSSPVVKEGRLILRHRKGDVEIVECFDAISGESIWTNETPTTYRCRFEYSSGPYSTPVIDGERVYSLSAQGVLQCCRFSDGKRVWEQDLAATYDVAAGMFAVGTSPVVDGERVIVAIGGGKPSSSVVALNKQTGEVVWTGGEGKGTMATPRVATIHGKRYVFVLLDAGLFALDPETGKEYWRVPFHQSNPEKVVGTSPAVSGDLVMITGFSLGSLGIRVLPEGGFQQLWRKRRNFDSQYANVVCLREYAFGFASRDRTLRCINMTNGEVCWKWKSLTGVGSSIAIGGRLVVATERGKLACFQINTNKPVLESITADALLDYPVFAGPAAVQGRLYLRNDRFLRCYRLPVERSAATLPR